MKSLRPWQLAVILSAILPLMYHQRSTANPGVRPAYCAGNWYPHGPAELKGQVDALLDQAPPSSLSGKPIAVISPHAGYRYSAAVAAAGYECLRGHAYNRVMILAFSHRSAGRYRGVDVPLKLTAYSTPLGQVAIDREACDALLKHPLFESRETVDRGEHSLELQLPFLQRVLDGWSLVPLLIGQMSEAELSQAAEAILPWMDEDTLLVASTDFTHFGPNYNYQPFAEDVPKRIGRLADRAADAITRCDYDGFAAHLAETNDTICGRGPVRLLLRTLSMRGGAAGVRTAYDTSGQITGDWSNSVTYQSFVFTHRPGTLNEEERSELLHLARKTVAAFLRTGSPPSVDAEQMGDKLSRNGACFVTLENGGKLRGCIGNMVAKGPLFRAVMRNAASACRDRRFINNPVTAEELDELRIEISYLTPMKPVSDPDEVVVGLHGLYLELGSRTGVLLPQVAYERGWTRERFLAQTCRKAGLPPDAWKHPEAMLYCFRAEVFGETESSSLR